jgi:hypothetical protein
MGGKRLNERDKPKSKTSGVSQWYVNCRHREMRLIRYLIITISILFGTDSLWADAIPNLDQRYVSGSCSQSASPNSPFAAFDATVGTCNTGGVTASGHASQTSLVNMSNGAMTGFSGSMGASADGRNTSGFTSQFDLTFTLQETNYFSNNVIVTTEGGGADWVYALSFNGVFAPQFSSGTSDSSTTFADTGTLGPGQYHVSYWLTSFHADQNFQVSGSVATNFALTLTPVTAQVPEGGSTLMMIGMGFALVAMAARTAIRHSSAKRR